jgi:hypothetical protein
VLHETSNAFSVVSFCLDRGCAERLGANEWWRRWWWRIEFGGSERRRRDRRDWLPRHDAGRSALLILRTERLRLRCKQFNIE